MRTSRRRRWCPPGAPTRRPRRTGTSAMMLVQTCETRTVVRSQPPSTPRRCRRSPTSEWRATSPRPPPATTSRIAGRRSAIASRRRRRVPSPSRSPPMYPTRLCSPSPSAPFRSRRRLLLWSSRRRCCPSRRRSREAYRGRALWRARWDAAAKTPAGAAYRPHRSSGNPPGASFSVDAPREP